MTTVHLAPDQVVAALSAEFEDLLTAPEIEACILRIEAKLRESFPEITRLYVKPQAAGEYAARLGQFPQGAGLKATVSPRRVHQSSAEEISTMTPASVAA